MAILFHQRASHLRAVSLHTSLLHCSHTSSRDRWAIAIGRIGNDQWQCQCEAVLSEQSVLVPWSIVCVRLRHVAYLYYLK